MSVADYHYHVLSTAKGIIRHTMWQLILVVAAAVAASAFCSMSEAALLSLPWSRIEDLRRQHRKSGDTLYALRQDVELPITAILTLNTVANTAGASIAGALAAKVLGVEHLTAFTLAFTLLVIIIGELIPKTVGVIYTRSLSPLLAAPLSWLVALFTPLNWAFGFLVRLIKGKGERHHATEDDIRAMVSLTSKAGLLKPFEEEAIRNILSLDQKTVEQVMTPRTVVFSLPAAMTVAQAVETKGFWSHSRVPVYEGEDMEEVVGLVYRRDVLNALAEDRHNTLLSQVMKPVEFVLDTMSLDRLLPSFLASRIHLYIVLDEYGGMAGVISLEDLVEEILGTEIVDETDQVADMRELARVRRASLVKAAQRQNDTKPE